MVEYFLVVRFFPGLLHLTISMITFAQYARRAMSIDNPDTSKS
jgi:hypothetical protein